MYFFYVDESGNLDPQIQGVRADGSKFDKDHLYVLTAISLYEHRWHGFEKTLIRKKWELLDLINRSTAPNHRLELADCEIKSTWIRIPKEREQHPFLQHLTTTQMQSLIDLYYDQLSHHSIKVFSVVVDKRHLHDYITEVKLHRKAWELLLEKIEQFMREAHHKHQAVLITDDLSRERNRSLAMKHAFILSEGTRSGKWLKHIAEMPLFVRSELSNGVQLADLVSYNIYRRFRYPDNTYEFFDKVKPFIWSSQHTSLNILDGITVFPFESPLYTLRI